MDSTEKPFTAVEWCAGYAGIHLGLKRVIPNLRVIAFSEIEAFACANLVAKMEAGLLDPSPIWPNLKTFPSAAFANKVDILVAGYPCQPFSAAGKRQGTEDERHLWPYIADGIRAMRPRFCFFENVEGHITLGLSTVISDLAAMGYKTTWGIFSASEVGAPHQRKRVFILGYSRDNYELRNGEQKLRGERVEVGGSSCLSEKVLAYSSSEGLQGLRQRSGQEGRQESAGYAGSSCNSRGQERSDCWPSRPGQEQFEWEPPRVMGNSSRDNVSRQTGGFEKTQGGGASTKQQRGEIEPSMGRDSDGSADRLDYAELYEGDQSEPMLYESCDNRVDELRLLGNGVVPATAARAWEVLYVRLVDP